MFMRRSGGQDRFLSGCNAYDNPEDGVYVLFMVPKAVESHLSTASHDELKALLGLLLVPADA